MPAGGLEDWEVRHARGEVPSRWPYGLDLLGSPSTAVELRFVGVPSRGSQLHARVSPQSRGAAGTTGLAWDENTAHRMVSTRRYAEMHSGVIWATDRGEGNPPGLRRALERMSSVWTLSQAQLDALDAVVPPGVARHFLKFGVDEEFFDEAPYPDQPTILSVGRDRHRDFDTLLEAFAGVVKARPGVRAVVQTPRDITAPAGVEVLPFLGHVELRQFYRQASVVAIATRPNLHVSGMTVALEAQSVGRPVVLTRTPGAEDYLSDGVTGHLTEVGDAAQMTSRLIDILDDTDSAAAMGSRGRTAVTDDLTTRHLAGRLRAVVTA